MLAARNEHNSVARGHLAFLRHAQVEPGSAALQEPLHHVRTTETDRQLEAGHARLGDRELRRTNPQPVPDANCVLEQTLSREVLSEGAPGERNTGKVLAPEGEMLRWVDIYGLVDPAVHGEVGLPVANYVESIDQYPAGYGSLEDRSRYGFAAPLNLARKPDVYRTHLHYAKSCIKTSPYHPIERKEPSLAHTCAGDEARACLRERLRWPRPSGRPRA